MNICRHNHFIFLLALVSGLITSLLLPAQAQCRYFRVAVNLLQCKEENPADLKTLSHPEMDIPELPTPSEGKLMQVHCSCDYTLSGSNPFCDFDRSQEFASAMGTGDSANPCAGAKAFCNQICPQNLN
jgi:hypothetical protein